MSESPEAVVRTILESVMQVSLTEWPAGRSLNEAGLYDSLAQLVTITRLEKKFGLAEGELDVDDVETVDRILAQLDQLARRVPERIL